MARILELPARGRLLVCTDLQGNLRDFERMAGLFEERQAEMGDAHVLFTGDMVHGPYLSPEEWPSWLGPFYRDQSGEVIDSLVALGDRYPGRVHALVGNHEHGHIGGPHTAKFAPDEVALLESVLGPERSARMQAVLAELPLVAVAPCGVVFTHGAPAADVSGRHEIEAADLAGAWTSPMEVLASPVVGQILWARSAPADVAGRFLAAMGGNIAVYGHDVVPEGFLRIGDEQILVSTSFGVEDRFKVYLELDLAGSYRTVHELAEGREIRALYASP